MMFRYIILLPGILGALVFGEEDKNTPKLAGQEFVAPLLEERAASPVPANKEEWEEQWKM